MARQAEIAAWTRKRVLTLAGAATAGGILSACGTPQAAPTKTGNTSTSSSASTSVATGALPVPRDQTVVQEQTPYTVFDSFNPFIPNGNQWASGWLQICNEPLFYGNVAAGKVVPWLATKFSLAKDHMSGTLYLRNDATWSDGHPFSATDVAFTFNMFLNNPHVFGSSWSRQIKSATAQGSNVVKFTFPTPQPRFMENALITVVTPPALIVPEHIWKGKDPATFTNNPPVATGAWKYHKVYPNLKMFVWARNDTYWGKKHGNFPIPKYVVYRTAPPVDEDLADFERGAIDWAGKLQYPQMKLAKEKLPGSDLITSFTDPCPRGMWFNCGKPPFNDRRFRWAMSYLVDRPTAAKVIWSPATSAARYPWSSWSWFKQYENAEAQKIVAKYDLSYNPTKAGQILDSLGYKRSGSGQRMRNGKPLSFEIITPVPNTGYEFAIAQMFAKAAAKQGVTVHVKSLSVGPTFGNDTATGNFSMTSHWLCGAMLDPSQLYDQFNSSKMTPEGARALTPDWARLKDPTFDSLDDQLDRTQPGSAAMPLYNKLLDRFLHDLPATPVIETVYPFLLSTKVWTGWPTNHNLYTVPDNWWSPSALVYFRLKRA